MLHRPASVVLPLLLALASCAGAQEDGFVPLSPGPGLEGWHVMGANSWEYADGAITCSGEGSGWLRSDAMYGDFTLRLQYRIAPGGNSGVWLRAPNHGRASATGIEYQILGTRATTPDANSNGSLYDILAPRLEAGRPAGEWNDVEIACRGTRIRAVLNGEELYDADMTHAALNARLPAGMKPSDRNLRGFLGLTNHGAVVAYRDIRIRPEPEQGFEALSGGADLAGWSEPASSPWTARDGAIACEAEQEATLATRAAYGDYTLRLLYRLQPGTRAFVSLRSNKGNRIQIALADDAGKPLSMESSGALRGYGAPRFGASFAAGSWNELEVTERGLTLDVRLNGSRVLDGSLLWYSGFYLPPLEGPLALGLTSGWVEFRDVRVARLASTPAE